MLLSTDILHRPRLVNFKFVMAFLWRARSLLPLSYVARDKFTFVPKRRQAAHSKSGAMVNDLKASFNVTTAPSAGQAETAIQTELGSIHVNL